MLQGWSRRSGLSGTHCKAGSDVQSPVIKNHYPELADGCCYLSHDNSTRSRSKSGHCHLKIKKFLCCAAQSWLSSFPSILDCTKYDRCTPSSGISSWDHRSFIALPPSARQRSIKPPTECALSKQHWSMDCESWMNVKAPRLSDRVASMEAFALEDTV